MYSIFKKIFSSISTGYCAKYYGKQKRFQVLEPIYFNGLLYKNIKRR